jgi:drug/metabolite transporter (DMT)-like permease
MNIILPIIASCILVTAQALWKKAFSSVVFTFSSQFLLSKDFLKIIFSTYFMAGASLYVIATVFYLYLFNRYSFYSVQSIMLVASITLAFIIASVVFKEPVTVYKIAGLSLLIFGIVLIYKK